MEKIYFIFLFILIVNSSNIDHNKVNTNNKGTFKFFIQKILILR